jgi:hypothetical protein
MKKHNAKGIEVWRHELEYSYSVESVSYCGTRLRFGVPASLLWLSPSDPSFQQYRAGATVVVIHSPLGLLSALFSVAIRHLRF